MDGALPQYERLYEKMELKLDTNYLMAKASKFLKEDTALEDSCI
jgi:hypothetical protein